MSFNSYGFLFIFFPIFFIVYRKLPAAWCKAALCAGGLVFYAVGVWRKPLYLLLLVGMTALGVLGCALLRRRGRAQSGCSPCLWLSRLRRWAMSSLPGSFPAARLRCRWG